MHCRCVALQEMGLPCGLVQFVHFRTLDLVLPAQRVGLQTMQGVVATMVLVRVGHVSSAPLSTLVAQIAPCVAYHALEAPYHRPSLLLPQVKLVKTHFISSS